MTSRKFPKNISNMAFFKLDWRSPLIDKYRELAKRGMEKLDITRLLPISTNKKEFPPEVSPESFSMACRFLQRINNPALRKIDVKMYTKNFSADQPVNTVIDADNYYFAFNAARVLESKSQAQAYADAFFCLFGDQYDQELANYATKKGKTPDMLTNAEHKACASAFTKKIAETKLADLYFAQKVPNISKIAHENATFEDFAGKMGSWNNDWKMFFRKHFHTRAKNAKMTTIEDANDLADAKTSVEIEAVFSADVQGLLHQLTSEEAYLAWLLYNNVPQCKIAKELGVAQSTVSKRVKALRKKMTNLLY